MLDPEMGDIWYNYSKKAIERKDAEIAKLRAVMRDLLESYLATFGGNKDELALRAEALLAPEQKVADE